MRGFGDMLTLCCLVLFGHILALAEVKSCDAGGGCNVTDQAALVQSRIRHRGATRKALDLIRSLSIAPRSHPTRELKAPVFAFRAVGTAGRCN